MPTENSLPVFAPLLPGTGKVIIPVGAGIDDGRAITLEGNDKILVGGYSKNGSNNDFSLVRLNADGSLDTSFDGDGKAIIPVGRGNDEAYCLTVQSDGKILLGGSSYNVSNIDYSIIRLNANGSLDSSFNSSGKVIIPVGNSNDFAYSISIQNDGKILLGGYSEKYGGSDYSLVQLNANGTLDSGFGTGGKALVDVGGSDFAYSLSVQSDGKIVIGGFSNEDYSVVRLNANGTLDSSFGIGGKSLVDMGGSDFAYSLGLQGDGKIVLGGHSQNSTSNSYSALQLNADGTLDSTFGNGGKSIVDVKPDGVISSGGIARSLNVQSDGKILLGGWINNDGDNDYGVVRLNANGSLDSTFGNGGKIVIPVGGGSDFAISLTLQSDGKVLMAGTSYTGSDTNFSLIRLNTDGSLDTTFGATLGNNTLGGTVSYSENAIAIVLDSVVAILDPELTALNNGQGNYSGSSVNLVRSTGANTQDVFGASGNLSFSDGNAILSGAIIGSSSQIGGTLDITFNTNATQARINEVLSSLTYANNSDAPPASVQINWTFSDGNAGAQGTGGAMAVTGSTLVNITAMNDAPSGSVTISGTAKQGQKLTAANTLKDADGLGTISYQWKADGASISGATGTSLTLSQSHVGKAISVTASYVDVLGSSEAKTSIATAKVANVNDAPTGSVIISGTAAQGQKLTAANTLKDADGLGTISYQWKADGASISGATGTSLTLSQSHVGKAISVTASYVDVLGSSEAKTSIATAKVANVNDAPTVANSIADKSGTEGVAFSFTLPTNLFTDLDNDKIVITASSLPSWLKFEAGKFTGIPAYTASESTYSIAVTANDGKGGTVTDAFDLVVANVETITGTAKADAITAGLGSDVIKGLAGNDTIDGGLGNDILTGGTGADSFKFTSALKSNLDRITDFTRGSDKLVLDDAIFTKLVGQTGKLSNVDYFKAGTNSVAADRNDYLIFNKTSGALFYDADGSGKGAAIQFATLVGVADLVASDFWIV